MSKVVISILLISLCLSSVSLGQEVAQDTPQTPEQETTIQPIDEAQQKADLDAEQAREEAALKEAEILYQEGTLKARVNQIEEERKAQEKLLKSLDEQYQENDKEIDRLQKRMEEQQGESNEIAGTVHGLAQDLGSVLRQSIISVEIPGRQAVLEPLLSETEFPSLENIKQMSELFFEEIEQNGKIAVNSLSFVDRSGKQTSGVSRSSDSKRSSPDCGSSCTRVGSNKTSEPPTLA